MPKMKVFGLLSFATTSETMFSTQIVAELSYSMDDIQNIFQRNDIKSLVELADNLVDANSETERRLASLHEAFLLESKAEYAMNKDPETGKMDQKDISLILAQNESIKKDIAVINKEIGMIRDKIMLFKFFDDLTTKYRFSEAHFPDLNEEHPIGDSSLKSLKEKSVLCDLEIAYLKTFIAHFENLALLGVESSSKNNIKAMPEPNQAQLGEELDRVQECVKTKKDNLGKVENEIKIVELEKQKDFQDSKILSKDILEISLKNHNINLKIVLKIKKTHDLERKMLNDFFGAESCKITGYIAVSIVAYFILCYNLKNN